jgi:hypothetical protein
MIGYLKRLSIHHLVSPFGLAVLSYLVFLFAWLFPPGLYTDYMHEPDLMYLDPEILLFYTTCVAAFLFGARFSRFLGASAARGAEPQISARSPLFYLLTPLVTAMSLCTIALVLVGQKINFVALLATQQGDAIKLAREVGQLQAGRWERAIPALTGVLWWSYFRASQLKIDGTEKTIFRLVFLLGLGIGIATCMSTVDRPTLMPIILGTLVVYLFRKTRLSSVRVLKLALTGVLSMAGIVGAFLFVSFLRGAVIFRVLITGLLGYSIVSYNRMAALLAGTMHYAYQGRGVYLSRYLQQDQVINDFFHLADRFGWPDALGLWQTEFSSTMAAGLNPAYIWAGTFGYIYSDLGWWAPLYLGAIGIIAGFLWSQYNTCNTFGIVLYPWMGFSVLAWFGPNFVFSNDLVRLLEFAMVLYVYDRKFLRQESRTNRIRAATDHMGSFLEPVNSGIVEGVI